MILKKLNILKEIFKLFIKSPRATLKQFNYDNYKTFRRAIENESPKQIIQNVRSLIQKTNTYDKSINYNSIDKFITQVQPQSDKRLIIFVSHEASRTGAPLILKEIASFMQFHHNVYPIILLCKGGELNKDFKAVCPTYVLKFFDINTLLSKEINYLMTRINQIKNISSIYINSEGSTKLLKYFSDLKLGPRVTLIHELGNYYPKGAWKHIEKFSDYIIFPANFVKTAAIANSNLSESKISIIGQGLLKPELLSANKTLAKNKLLKKHKIPVNAKIILSCGTIDHRKGADLFVRTAISVLNECKKLNLNSPYFIWLGGDSFSELGIWIKRDIQQCGYAKNIIIVPSQKDVTTYFASSDLFFLSSRGDPYPCVVHEALACQTPIISFAKSGGSNELIEKGFGYILPYTDTNSAKELLIRIIRKEISIIKIDLQKLKPYLSNERYVESLYNLVHE